MVDYVMKGRPTKHRCIICCKTLRIQTYYFFGHKNLKVPDIGTEIENLTLLKVIGKPSWYRLFKVGLWITKNNKRICTDCSFDDTAKLSQLKETD